MTSPDILALRGELAIQAFEGSQLHVQHVARWLDRADYQRAVEALKQAMPFWQIALEEMRAIRDALADDEITAEAAVEWRAERDAKRKMNGAAGGAR